MNNPYMSNYYPNPYPQQYTGQQRNPYMEQLNNLQQFQQALQQPQPQMQMPQPQSSGFLFGKIVDSVEMVRATDIPMDGNMYYFPKADGSELYGKRWLSNGTTEIVPYKPILEDKNEQQSISSSGIENVKFSLSEEFMDNLLQHIDKRFDTIEKAMAKPTNSRAKKESDSE